MFILSSEAHLFVQNTDQTYRSYPQRWSLVLSVALLNIANYSHWISFASVNSKAAIFYEVSTDDITRYLNILHLEIELG